MNRTCLLDANALIALVVSDHEHHERAAAWAATAERIALCPIVEGAVCRFLIRIGESPETAQALLAALHASSRVEFWPDSISYTDTSLQHVVGHRQVTGAYLASLAGSHGGQLATFDRALAGARPDVVQLIP